MIFTQCFVCGTIPYSYILSYIQFEEEYVPCTLMVLLTSVAGILIAPLSCHSLGTLHYYSLSYFTIFL